MKLEYINNYHIPMLYISITGLKIKTISISSWSIAQKE